MPSEQSARPWNGHRNEGAMPLRIRVGHQKSEERRASFRAKPRNPCICSNRRKTHSQTGISFRISMLTIKSHVFKNLTQRSKAKSLFLKILPKKYGDGSISVILCRTGRLLTFS